jgi:hypothetical protein
MKKTLYKYYQPNKLDKNNEYGDCVIRSLSKVWNCSWIEAFNETVHYQRKFQCPISGFILKLYKAMLMDYGFVYHGVSNAKGSKRPTVKSFASKHKRGKYLLSCAGHMVACVNGNYWDTFDSGYKCLYGYYEYNFN